MPYKSVRWRILRELSTFLFHITDGTWTGVRDLTLSTTCPSGPGNAFAWPVGRVNIGSKHHWDRGTLIHELSHQVMWKEAGISIIGIVNFVVSCNLHLIHSEDLLTNPTHALIEGWAEFMEGIFEHDKTPYSVGVVHDANDKPVGPLGPPPVNRGEIVEGAFANGLWEMFYHAYVVQSAGRPPMPESRNGDISTTAPWIKDPDVKRRFKGMIWDPLKDLKGKKDPTTADFIAKMTSMHPSEWHKFAFTLNQQNMAITPVSVT